MDSPQIWERQPNESPRAYSAFCTYRDMRPDRSLSKVCSELDKKPSYLRQLKEWSAQHKWVDRVAAYDANLDEKLLAGFEQTLVDRRLIILKKEIDHADKLLEQFDEILKSIEIYKKEKATKKVGGKEVEVIYLELNISGLHELTKWRRELAEFSRLSIGLPGRINGQQHTGKDGGALKIEWTEPLNDGDFIGMGADELPEAG